MNMAQAKQAEEEGEQVAQRAAQDFVASHHNTDDAQVFGITELAAELGLSPRAIRFYEKAAGLMEADLNSPSLLISCYMALGDVAGMRRSAQRTLKRAEVILAHDQNNSMVARYSAYALAALGEGERAKARMERALLIDPANWNMRYNFACALMVYLKDKEASLGMLGPVFDTITDTFLPYAKADPDLDLLRDDPRYRTMLEAAEARLAAETGKPTTGR